MRLGNFTIKGDSSSYKSAPRRGYFAFHGAQCVSPAQRLECCRRAVDVAWSTRFSDGCRGDST